MAHPLGVLLLLQAASPTASNVEYRAPANWVPVDAPPLVAFAPAGLAPGQAVLLILWPAERIAAPDDFAAWFERKLVGPGETVLQRSAVERGRIDGLDALTAAERVLSPEGGQLVRVVYAIAGGGRAALAMLSGNQDDLVSRYAVQAQEFFESLRFAGPAATVPSQPVPPTRGPMPVTEAERAAIPAAGFDGNEPRGLFYRLQVAFGSGGMETQTRIFLPSRRLIRTYPFGGGDSVDLTRCNPDMCGAYQLEGEWLTVRWDTGDTQRLRFARSENGFTLDGDAFRPARGLTAAEAVGVWVNPASAASPLDTGLRLDADGSFQWAGGGGDASTLRGRYALHGLTLVLSFADGTSRPYTLFAASRTQPSGLISLDGSVYTRR
jgi:hypothetical protein